VKRKHKKKKNGKGNKVRKESMKKKEWSNESKSKVGKKAETNKTSHTRRQNTFCTISYQSGSLLLPNVMRRWYLNVCAAA